MADMSGLNTETIAIGILGDRVECAMSFVVRKNEDDEYVFNRSELSDLLGAISRLIDNNSVSLIPSRAG